MSSQVLSVSGQIPDRGSVDAASVDDSQKKKKTALENWEKWRERCVTDLRVKTVFFACLPLISSIAVVAAALEALTFVQLVGTGYLLSVAYVAFNLFHGNPRWDRREYHLEDVCKAVCNDLKNMELDQVVKNYSISALTRYGIIQDRNKEGLNKNEKEKVDRLKNVLVDWEQKEKRALLQKALNELDEKDGKTREEKEALADLCKSTNLDIDNNTMGKLSKDLKKKILSLKTKFDRLKRKLSEIDKDTLSKLKETNAEDADGIKEFQDDLESLSDKEKLELIFEKHKRISYSKKKLDQKFYVGADLTIQTEIKKLKEEWSSLQKTLDLPF